MKTFGAALLEHCKSLFDDVVAIRRDIHMNPELEHDVHRTAAIAAAELAKLGMKVKRGVGTTGVVGDLECPGAARRIALRADMDALPMQELGNLPFKSKVEGKAHMCGHDVHTAMLIGAARVISQSKGELKANIRFIFQPCEEKFPGGAPGMIQEGALDGVDEIYGMHVWPLIETGRYALCSGAALGQADTFKIEIIGKGGHAAVPHMAVDPVVIGSQFVTVLQSVVSRNIDPLDSAVISVTQFHGGTTHNVIPSSVRIEGTIRALTKEVQALIQIKMDKILSGITAAHGATYHLSFQEGYPVTLNHEPCVAKVLFNANKLVGVENVIFPFPPILGSEDFGYYSQKVPACFVFLGSGNKERGIVNMCHNPRFDVDEKCMIYGMALYASLALES